MTKIEQNDSMRAGEAKVITFTVYQEDGETVQNITGASFTWKLAEDEWGDAVLTKTGTILVAASGTLTVTLDETDTDDLQGVYYHKLKMTDASDNDTIPTVGWLTIHGTVH